MALTKAELRVSLLSQREALSPDTIAYASKKVCRTLSEHPHIQKAQSIAAYLPFKNELNPWHFIHDCLHQKKNIYIPRYNPENNSYSLAQLTEKTVFVKGKYGIPEPGHKSLTLSMEQALTAIEAWVIPGVAFDKTGARLGMGKGYYDRFLNNSTGLKIGICFRFQYLESIPQDDWDVKMDTIFSE